MDTRMDDSFEECEIARGRRVPLPPPAIRLTAVGISFPENSHFAVVVSNGASLAAVNACLCKADAGRVVSWVAEHCADRGLPFCKLLPEMFGDLQAHQRGDRPRVSSAQVDTLVVRDGQVMALSGLDELDCARDSADLAPIGRSLLCHECDALLERNHGHVLQAFARNLSRLNDWAAEVFAFHPDAEVPSHARARRDNVARMSSPCAALAFRCYAYGHPHLMDPHCESPEPVGSVTLRDAAAPSGPLQLAERLVANPAFFADRRREYAEQNPPPIIEPRPRLERIFDDGAVLAFSNPIPSRLQRLGIEVAGAGDSWSLWA